MLLGLVMKKLPSHRFQDSALVAILVAGAASATVACSKEEPKRAAWSCTTAEVPMGEVVRCTSAALTSDGPAIDGTASTSGGTGTTDGVDGTISFTWPTYSDLLTGGGTGTEGTGGTDPAGTGGGTGTTDGTTDGTTGGGGDEGWTVYECGAGSDNPDCPPSDGTSTDGSANTGSGTGTPGTPGSSGSSGSSGNGTKDGSDSATNGNGNGNGGGGGSSSGGNGSNAGDGSGSSAGNNGNGNGGKGPVECSYVSELPYCGGDSKGSGTGTAGASSGGTPEETCTRPPCTAPGHTKDGTSAGASSSSGSTDKNSSGASSSGASGGTTGGDGSKGSSGGASSSGVGDGSKGKGHTYVCKKDKKGNKACQSVPSCAPGSHPGACGACIGDDEPAGDCRTPKAGGCWVTGGGFVVGANIVTGAAADGHDNFGGNAKPMKDGTIKGHWNHVDHGTGNHAKGRPSYIYCRKVDEPGPGQPGGKKGFVMNQVYFGGPAEWRDAATGAWGEGYWFDVVAKDHGEPGSVPKAKNGFMPDTYHFTIRLIDDPAQNASGTVVYATRGELQGGNIQLHPPNGGHPATPSVLPSWVSLEP